MDKLNMFTADDAKTLGQLSQIRIFTVAIWQMKNNFNESILEMVKQWKSLEYFKLTVLGGNKIEIKGMKNKLIDILKSRTNHRQFTTTVNTRRIEISSTK